MLPTNVRAIMLYIAKFVNLSLPTEFGFGKIKSKALIVSDQSLAMGDAVRGGDCYLPRIFSGKMRSTIPSAVRITYVRLSW